MLKPVLCEEISWMAVGLDEGLQTTLISRNDV